MAARFAWAASNGKEAVNSGETDFCNPVSNTGTGAHAGFVHREQQALIMQWLAGSTLLIPAGLALTLLGARGRNLVVRYVDGGPR